MHAELKNNDLQSIKNTVFGTKTGKREYCPPLYISSLNAGLTKKYVDFRPKEWYN
jgi:hypothetical protein